MPTSTDQLPDFLIIGAMKAGTTTLYRDLLTNPAVFMPLDKEPGNLCRHEVLTPEGRRAYAELFSRAKAGQILGEASTNYSKLPDYPGVPERARQVLGPDLRVVYLVREPVARIISHHYHSYCTGLFGPDINREVREKPALLNYSRYAMQIRPWIEAFGRSNVRIVVFEEYIADRRGTVAELSRFLGITPDLDRIDEEAVYNRSDGKPIGIPIWKALRRSSVYRRGIAPLVPQQIRDRLREAIHPVAPPRPVAPSPVTIRFLLEQLQDDLHELNRIVNPGTTRPIWDCFASDELVNGTVSPE